MGMPVRIESHLYELARSEAAVEKRTIAGQIEYWATLGQIVEHTGLSVPEARLAIEQYETAAAQRQQATAPTSVDALTARLLTAQARGTLAQRVRSVVLENQAKASA